MNEAHCIHTHLNFIVKNKPQYASSVKMRVYIQVMLALQAGTLIDSMAEIFLSRIYDM